IRCVAFLRYLQSADFRRPDHNYPPAVTAVRMRVPLRRGRGRGGRESPAHPYQVFGLALIERIDLGVTGMDSETPRREPDLLGHELLKPHKTDKVAEGAFEIVLIAIRSCETETVSV